MLQDVKLANEWDAAVAAGHEQAERVRDEAPADDFWRGMAHRFTPSPRDETEDPMVTAVADALHRDATLIDVGAGGGRLAIPLAARCRAVDAVEPSPAMQERLREAIAEGGFRNIRILPTTWDTAEVEPADVVLCAHVLYTASPITPFVQKMVDRARERMIVILNECQPIATYYPLWPMVHGEERIALPAAPQFVGLVKAWGIEAEIGTLPPRRVPTYPDMETALDQASRRLFVSRGSRRYQRLEEVLQEVLREDEKGDLMFPWAEPNVPYVIAWRTDR